MKVHIICAGVGLPLIEPAHDVVSDLGDLTGKYPGIAGYEPGVLIG